MVSVPGQEINPEVLNSLISRIFIVEDVTMGNPQLGYLVRYRGRLRGEDSAAAYDQIAESLRPLAITPLFRIEQDRQAIILVNGVVKSRPSNPWVNVALAVLTIFSVLIAGGYYAATTDPFSNGISMQTLVRLLAAGLPYGLSLMAILGAHEFGHYLVGRFHKTQVTLPYFLPMPFPGTFGTLGAFINMKEPPKNRRILLDIGIAGPLAGLIVAIPVLLYGLSLSGVDRLPLLSDHVGFQLEGNSLIYLASKFLMFHRLLPAPISYGGLSPLVYWLRYFITSQPLPYGGTDVILNPIAWAGWVGILVTALNLIPAGQLDGGHMMYVLLGKGRAQKVLPVILAVLVALGFVWTGWWLWAALIFLLGRVYAEPLDQITTLDPPRKALAVLAIIIFFLVFTPVPLIYFLGG
ncbi:MAG TPA: site-2 protease family protein [Anaerolineaceae bacterium]